MPLVILQSILFKTEMVFVSLQGILSEIKMPLVILQGILFKIEMAFVSLHGILSKNKMPLVILQSILFKIEMVFVSLQTILSEKKKLFASFHRNYTGTAYTLILELCAEWQICTYNYSNV
jgi:hypothetical protein